MMITGHQSIDQMPPGQVHVICRPLVSHVSGRSGWVKVLCEDCGCECWKRPSEEPDPLPANVVARCTNCALKRADRPN